jgi:hypothetical protein
MIVGLKFVSPKFWTLFKLTIITKTKKYYKLKKNMCPLLFTLMEISFNRNRKNIMEKARSGNYYYAQNVG